MAEWPFPQRDCFFKQLFFEDALVHKAVFKKIDPDYMDTLETTQNTVLPLITWVDTASLLLKAGKRIPEARCV